MTIIAPAARGLALAALAAVSGAALPGASAAQDADAGRDQFGRQCVACHVVQSPEGEILAGRSARTGPNLWGIAGQVPGTRDGFTYGESLDAYGQTGAIWDEASFVAYVQDPTGFLRHALGDRRARSRMAFQVRNEATAVDLWAYLSTFGE